ncbi:MbnH family di-heme enzyme [Phenylobacterium sp.]|uniref:MbnH family di-heme enzyme n=1 Tax=Phenylobacterium sp. TaxID=1871053 RepID=UPI0035B1CF33
MRLRQLIVGAAAGAVAFAALGSLAQGGVAALGDYVAGRFDYSLPAWIPAPLEPKGNPTTKAKVELGRLLFYDKRLSRDGTMSCASCHEQARAFTDGRATSVGVTGQHTPRNAMSIANVGYLPVLTWANPSLTSLERQTLVPLLGAAPVELGIAGRDDEVQARLMAEPRYPPLFRKAFPEARGEVSLGTITRAIAAFERTVISVNSPYDRYRAGETSALSAEAQRGEALFFSERLECHHCHSGLHMTDSVMHTRNPLGEVAYHNTGLYNLDGKGAYPADNTGVAEITGRSQDMGRFRTPSLRNVAVTAPYMHDGSIATLDEAIDHYAAGGRTIASGPYAGVGAANPLKSSFLSGFTLTPQERKELIAFLNALTDQGLLTDPRFSDPWREQSNR